MENASCVDAEWLELLILLPLPLHLQSLSTIIWSYCSAQRSMCYAYSSQITDQHLKQFPQKSEPLNYATPDIIPKLKIFSHAFKVVKEVIFCSGPILFVLSNISAVKKITQRKKII